MSFIIKKEIERMYQHCRGTLCSASNHKVWPPLHTAIWANIQLLSLKNSEISSILAIQVTRKGTEYKRVWAIRLICSILKIKIPLIYMVVLVIIDQHLKKSMHKISTAVCTSSSNSFIHPNFHSPVFSSLFQY
jgi:hypothetical protein